MKTLYSSWANIGQMDEEGYTPLYKAALEGHLEGAQDLISRGANPNRQDKVGLRPLHAAAQEGHAHIVDYLILQGADVNVECDLGQTPLHKAASSGYTCIIDSLIAEGANINKEDNTGRTPFNDAVQSGHLKAIKYLMTEGVNQNRYGAMSPLYDAAYFGHLNIVRFFVSNGAEVDEENDDGMTPLHGAAIQGHLEVMAYLTQQGSNVNKQDETGWTPFNAAVQYGHLEAVKYLMTKGAKQDRNGGMTPLHNAAKFGNLDIVKFVISNGADVNEEDDDGMIPLHGAAGGGHMKVMEYLIQHGSDVNKSDARSWTPIIAAVQNGHLGAVEYLMTEGAKPNRDGGLPPLYAAANFGHLDIIELLVSKGADVNTEDDDGMTPLHGAAARGHMKVVEYLIQYGSDVNKKDNNGWTPFNAAVKNGHLEVVKLLWRKGAQGTRFKGLTPLYIATQYDHIEVVNFLVSNGYDVNERNECGKSSRHAGCYNGSMDIVNVLIHHNANGNEQDHGGWTPRRVPAQEGHRDVVYYHHVESGADMAAVNAGYKQPIECISSRRGGPEEEETGDPRTGGNQNIITRRYVTVSLKDADTQLRKGHLACRVHSVEDGNDCNQAIRGNNELFLNNLPTMIHDDVNIGREEHYPFIYTKLNYPEKGEEDPMLDQIEGIKSFLTTNSVDGCSPHGSQTWLYSGFGQQTIETVSHLYEEPESRCHSPIDMVREMRESSSPMNAGNDPPINGTSQELDSFPRHPSAVVHQKLYDGNPVSSQGTSSNPVWKIGTKRRTSVDRCPSILALVQTFLQIIIALAILLAGSPVLVAGSDSIERVTLQAGKRGVVPFHLPSPPSDTFQGAPYFTLRFESRPRPFSINGEADIEGFKSPSQFQRFTISVTDSDDAPCVNLIIDNVDTLDEDRYVLTVVWHSFENVKYEHIQKEVDVHTPPGRAKCFITLSETVDYPYEVHCRATTGSVTTTLSCYLNDQQIDVNITDTDQVTRGTFFLPYISRFSCCSHYVTSHVSKTMCNDFEWPPDMHDKETASQIVNTVPTSITNNISRPAHVHNATTLTPWTNESQKGSGTSKQFILRSVLPFVCLLIPLALLIMIRMDDKLKHLLFK